MQNDQIRALFEHRYVTSQLTDRPTFEYIKTTLGALGYDVDNNAMIHDYLHFMIEDFLTNSRRAFITQKQIEENEVVKAALAGWTPDLVIDAKGLHGVQDPKPLLIIDIYTGKEEPSKVKGKYRTLDDFDVKVVTHTNFTKELIGVLEQKEIAQLYDNFQVFMTEYQYWHSCLKLRKILLNDIDNLKPVQLCATDAPFDVSRQQLLLKLQRLGENAIERRKIARA